MQEELAKMDKYKVWEVVPRSPDMRVVGARWVFTRKIDGETGKPSAYKARWVTKGFSQIEGIDVNELFAAVAHKDSIGYSSRLSTISTLNAIRSISKRLSSMATLMRLVPPEGSNISADKILHLRKSLYDLKQSPRCFNKAFDEWLRGQGLTPARADPCIYTRRQGNTFLMLSVHVDDQDQVSMHSSTRSITNSNCHDRISNNDGKSTFSPTIAESRTSQDAQKRQRARSFGLLAFRTPRLPRFTFCATAEIET